MAMDARPIYFIFPKNSTIKVFLKNISTLILVIVLGLFFLLFLDKKDRLGKSTKNGRLKG